MDSTLDEGTPAASLAPSLAERHSGLGGNGAPGVGEPWRASNAECEVVAAHAWACNIGRALS
eukprot:7714734-Alexandrium_andersonii.AAC.1